MTSRRRTKRKTQRRCPSHASSTRTQRVDRSRLSSRRRRSAMRSHCCFGFPRDNDDDLAASVPNSGWPIRRLRWLTGRLPSMPSLRIAAVCAWSPATASLVLLLNADNDVADRELNSSSRNNTIRKAAVVARAYFSCCCCCCYCARVEQITR